MATFGVAVDPTLILAQLDRTHAITGGHDASSQQPEVTLSEALGMAKFWALTFAAVSLQTPWRMRSFLSSSRPNELQQMTPSMSRKRTAGCE